jgi:hypothetical protein
VCRNRCALALYQVTIIIIIIIVIVVVDRKLCLVAANLDDIWPYLTDNKKAAQTRRFVDQIQVKPMTIISALIGCLTTLC